MKKIKMASIAIVLIFFNTLCRAQDQVKPTPEQWVGVEKEMIKSAPYIFQGTITEEKYYDGKSQVVSTCIMQITKIYKGAPQIKLGSIKILTGHAVKNGEGNTSSEGEGMDIEKGGRYILFCKIANISWLVDSTATDNTVTLTRLNCCNYPIVFTGKNSVQWGYGGHTSIDSLYSFFKENGLTVQQEVQQNK